MNKAIFKLFIISHWQKYIFWCDDMGLMLENQHCCLPIVNEHENNIVISIATLQPTIDTNVGDSIKRQFYD
ncbi:hypothetical protein [Shewanella sp. MEBiC00475]|uniref:hypothetical protein n=1 Tax=Shewanella sp. MEBiC00475 TaxID=2575361 RepID=UPI0010C039C5|nr:hypothetical protein [Shewanella sp. MEBiC00475]